MAHYINLSGGKIEISRSAGEGAKRGVPTRFPAHRKGEDEAADFLAQLFMETYDFRVMSSSSVNHPADEGCPDFDMDRFLNTLQAKLEAAGAMDLEG